MDKNFKVKYSNGTRTVDITVIANSFKIYDRTVVFYDFSGTAVFAYCNVYSVEEI